jgi:hypothetical protein
VDAACCKAQPLRCLHRSGVGIEEEHDAAPRGLAHVVHLDPVAIGADKTGEARDPLLRQARDGTHGRLQVEPGDAADRPVQPVQRRTQRLAERGHADLGRGRAAETKEQNQDQDDAGSHSPYAYRQKNLCSMDETLGTRRFIP